MGRNSGSKKPDLDSAGGAWCRQALCIALLILLPGHASAASSFGEQDPTVTVRRAMNEILYILTELKDASRSTQRQWELEQVVRRSFNYEAMAERSLGEAWTSLNTVERRQYIRIFVQLVRDEADSLREYSAAEIAYLSEESDEQSARVMTAPAGPNVDLRLEIPVVRRSGSWVLNDLRRDGVSMLTNYQTQFSRILRGGSFSDLMEHMKQKALLAKVTEEVES